MQNIDIDESNVKSKFYNKATCKNEQKKAVCNIDFNQTTDPKKFWILYSDFNSF